MRPVLATWLLLLGSPIACSRPPDERAFEACRGEVAQRLVDPTSARYERIRVEWRSGDGRDVVDGWDVHVAVEAHTGEKKIARSLVQCTLGTRFELLDLTGERQPDG